MPKDDKSQAPKKPEDAPDAPQADAEDAPEVPAGEAGYSRERLERDADGLLGVAGYVVAGAIAASGTDKETFTKAEAETLVNEFLNG